MSTPSTPDSSAEALRKASNRRVFFLVLVFTLLLAGALTIFFREEKRRGMLVLPEPIPPAPELELSAPTVPTTPEPAEAEAPAPVSPALQQVERMEEALAAYREASEYLRNGRSDLAEKRALAALAIHPQMASAQRLIGLIALQQGRIDRAIAMLENSLRLEPFHPDALCNLAFAYLQARNTDLALELIQTCRRLHPNYEPALVQEGLILLTQSDAQLAVDTLRKAVDAFPNRAAPRNNLAVALARIGDREGAREQLDILLRMDPANFSALFNFASLHAQETNAAAAIPWLRKAMALQQPAQFRVFLNDTDFDTIRDTPEFKAFLLELDPRLPVPPPPAP